MAKGFDSDKRWGNSAQKGHGVNSPAMMAARAKFDKDAKNKAIHAKSTEKESRMPSTKGGYKAPKGTKKRYWYK